VRFINKKYQAVFFDLGGTLIPLPDLTIITRKMASILEAPVEEFFSLWYAKSEGLISGIFPDYHSYTKHVCAHLEIEPPVDKINAAADLPFGETRRVAMTPHEGAIELLTYLKSNGYKTGLITDCAADVPEIWDETPFAPLIDITVYSCSEGMNKGSPRIFELAAEKLDVEPGKCLFIADGNRNELANATRVGMRAVRLLIPEEIDYDSPLREQWDGPVISSLSEVRNLVE
jgi:putative hydrolase of the HAD superfamily